MEIQRTNPDHEIYKREAIDEFPVKYRNLARVAYGAYHAWGRSSWEIGHDFGIPPEGAIRIQAQARKRSVFNSLVVGQLAGYLPPMIRLPESESLVDGGFFYPGEGRLHSVHSSLDVDPIPHLDLLIEASGKSLKSGDRRGEILLQEMISQIVRINRIADETREEKRVYHGDILQTWINELQTTVLKNLFIENRPSLMERLRIYYRIGKVGDLAVDRRIEYDTIRRKIVRYPKLKDIILHRWPVTIEIFPNDEFTRHHYGGEIIKRLVGLASGELADKLHNMSDLAWTWAHDEIMEQYDLPYLA